MGGASSRDQEAETSYHLENATAESSNSSFFTDEELTKLKSDYESGGVEKVKTVVQQKITELDNTELNVAVTGGSGAGKSSFINAMRGLQFNDEGAAEVGNIETTMEPTGYKHPNLPNVCFWDLPGIGSLEMPLNKYLKEMKFNKYDFVVIISACRFTENDSKLAKEIKRLVKNFYFVRSKIDNDLDSNRKGGKQFNEEEELKKIRNDCVSKLQRTGIPSPRVFLISNFDLNLYDFSLLNKALEDDPTNIMKNMYILALPNLNSEIVEKKRKELRKRIWMLAILSGVIGVVPVPGVSLGCDIRIVIGEIVRFQQCLGLNDSSLQSLAKRAGKSVEDLKAVVTTPLVGGEITPDVINRLAWGAAAETVPTIELAVWLIPVIGPIFVAASSFLMTYKLLSGALDDLTESAQKVVMAAFGTEK
ncbi:interferon-inducible GTPase 5-like [Hemiscyllium ocellatum]|uniref:interferon-inducible GTPase 5-like n=1 Tax=Hemiscyllium ocellatum TaxID=170820 RepID=UPI002966967C|nr:interferon-inducible GTPase 5-like [Hemiscyllium ocellatum]XP_060688564.1 interferon-inducible GTPase 5-like [Hemiscyllium ocellatum]